MSEYESGAYVITIEELANGDFHTLADVERRLDNE